jgi:predicted AlkP superfamily pyrophosphatase or phosphodiesterase
MAAAGFSLPAGAQSAARPKLVVVLMADQFSYDFLARYQDKLGGGGFKFLLEHGANFTNCRYQQANTQTAPGHAVVAAGAYPWSTGIIGDSWWDRRKGKLVEAVSDETQQLVGGNGPAGSTRAMNGTTIGDEFKLASNGRSKVFTVSLKDRAALFLAGRLANEAFWFDTKTGNFVSSSQYGHELPFWSKTFNDQHFADRYFGKPWQRLLPENQYTSSTRDDYPWEHPIAGDGRQFPHVITGGVGSPGEAYYNAFEMTPWANQLVADFAREAVEHENLGDHTDPDFLGVSFSAGDYLGHSFGPYSQEVEDLVLRLDQTLASFFQYLDQKVGLDKCLIVFTADHGAMPIPEWLKEKGMDAGRIDPKSFKNLLNVALSSRLGQDEWIEAFEPPNLYLNLDAVDKQKYRQPDVEALAAKLARSVPGVGEVYTAVQFFLNQLPSGPNTDFVRKNYYGARSGELYVVTKPGYIFMADSAGTNHGSPYAYDSQVPLILYGAGVTGGRYGADCSPADIAPTIAALTGIQVPSLCEGRVLSEAVAQEYGPFRPRAYAAAEGGGSR